MLHAFLTYINEQKLFQPTEKILLAVSGGKDSVAMFDLFCGASLLGASELGKKLYFAVAHCNFQLRGKDSDEDEIFVENLCRKTGIEYYSKTFNTKTFAKANNISIEMAARTLRYEWFESLRNEHVFAYIATAHHLNDSIETVLLNLTKGTGISGLKGILPKNGFIIRPLLFASRQEIEDYVAQKKLSWREDISNASNEYQRNLIRNEVVPLLKKINPNFDNTFARNLERFQLLEQDFRKNLGNFKATIMREENGVFFLKIANIKYWQVADYYLEELLKEFNFNYFQSKEIFQSMDGLSGKKFHSSTYTLIKDREELILISTENQDKKSEEIIIEDEKINNKIVAFEGGILRFTLLENTQMQTKFVRNNALLYLDFEKITFPLTLRKWQEGDWFIPLGMKGKKKISDFLIDKKVSIHLKKVIFLLTSKESIIWVVNQRADDRFKITETTKQVLKVEYL